MKMMRTTFRELGRWSGVASKTVSPASHHHGMPPREWFSLDWPGIWVLIPTAAAPPYVK